LSVSVTVSGNTYETTIDTGATASEELADNLPDLEKIAWTRRQVRMQTKDAAGKTNSWRC